MKTKGQFFIVIGLIIVGLTGFVINSCCQKEEAEKKPIKIGINVWPGYAYAFIAQEKGFFKKNGVNVELILDKEISETEARYKEEGVDGLFTTFSDIIYINDEGIETKVVSITDISMTSDAIIARPDISSVADLKGKVVSFEGVNSFSHIFVVNAIEKAGLSESEVNFKNIPSQEISEALESGKISAGHTWDPAKTELIKKGYKIIAVASDYDYMIIDVLAFNSKIIQSRPDEVKAIIKSLFEALDYLQTHELEAIKLMAEAEGISVEAISNSLNGLSLVDLKQNRQSMDDFGLGKTLSKNAEFIANFYLEHGQKDQIRPLNDIIERKFIYELSGVK